MANAMKKSVTKASAKTPTQAAKSVKAQEHQACGRQGRRQAGQEACSCQNRRQRQIGNCGKSREITCKNSGQNLDEGHFGPIWGDGESRAENRRENRRDQTYTHGRRQSGAGNSESPCDQETRSEIHRQGQQDHQSRQGGTQGHYPGDVRRAGQPDHRCRRPGRHRHVRLCLAGRESAGPPRSQAERFPAGE